jgi:hypothetical protein
MSKYKIETGLPKWAIDQDEREEELKKKYPVAYNDICRVFYEARNYNPNTTPEECFEIALARTRKISDKVEAEFRKVFVENFEKGIPECQKL